MNTVWLCNPMPYWSGFRQAPFFGCIFLSFLRGLRKTEKMPWSRADLQGVSLFPLVHRGGSWHDFLNIIEATGGLYSLSFIEGGRDLPYVPYIRDILFIPSRSSRGVVTFFWYSLIIWRVLSLFPLVHRGGSWQSIWPPSCLTKSPTLFPLVNRGGSWLIQ
jgi:hypothetical protein